MSISVTGPGGSASVWRNRTSRRLVGPAARRVPRDCRPSSSTRRGRRFRATTTPSDRTSRRSIRRRSSATSPHSWFGPKPAAWPAWLPFSPALLILPIPGVLPADLLLLPRRVLQGVLGRPAVVHGRRAALELLGRELVSARPAERPSLHALPVARRPARSSLRRVEGAVVHRSGDRHGVVRHRRRHAAPGGQRRAAQRLPVRLPLAASSSSAAASTSCRARRWACTAYSCVSCLNRRHMVWAWCSLFSVGFS